MFVPPMVLLFRTDHFLSFPLCLSYHPLNHRLKVYAQLQCYKIAGQHPAIFFTSLFVTTLDNFDHPHEINKSYKSYLFVLSCKVVALFGEGPLPVV